MTKSEKIRQMLFVEPRLSSAYIADKVGCTKRLVRLVKEETKPDLPVERRAPKILVFDIETSPMEVYVWGLFKQRISIDQVIKDWSLLSWSAKWLFSEDVMGMKVTPIEAMAREDASIIQPLWNLLDEADIVVGHNAQKFDVRKANMRFALNGLLPPMPYRVIDTMKHAMKVFGSASYKMDWLNKVFGNDPKVETKYQLWVDCVNGDEDALDYMLKYNMFDVQVTEELYMALRPWMKGHPNVNLYMDTIDVEACTNCGSVEIEWGGHYYTPAGKYEAYRCEECGSIGRNRIADLSKEERANLLLSVAS